MMLETITMVEVLIACMAVGISTSVAISIAAYAAMEKLNVSLRWRKPISIAIQIISGIAVIYLAIAI